MSNSPVYFSKAHPDFWASQGKFAVWSSPDPQAGMCWDCHGEHDTLDEAKASIPAGDVIATFMVVGDDGTIYPHLE